ncbi:unnamed protein product [Brassica rapa subsp. narinosa]|uniref:(rape) hypothetical protein n=1 Tax=Brassica napus TaxID=3708 RepID=A0A816TQT4_BRANA|nr:unnamed protein product [Brassica napus]
MKIIPLIPIVFIILLSSFPALIKIVEARVEIPPQCSGVFPSCIFNPLNALPWEEKPWDREFCCKRTFSDDNAAECLRFLFTSNNNPNLINAAQRIFKDCMHLWNCGK